MDELEKGFDAVGGYRKKREDIFFLRRLPSFCMSKLMGFRSGIKAKDWGCSFGALNKDIADKILSYDGSVFSELGLDKIFFLQ